MRKWSSFVSLSLAPQLPFHIRFAGLKSESSSPFLCYVDSLTIESGSPRILWSFGGALALLVICRRVLRRPE